MKKVILAALLVIGISAMAQEQAAPAKKNAPERLTVEQRNELRLKKMTLELDLTAAQQKEMKTLIAEQSAKRETAMAERKAAKAAGKKPTADERFAMENKKLDEQIAMKEKVKKILTPQQLEKWEKMRNHNRDEMKSRIRKKQGENAKPGR